MLWLLRPSPDRRCCWLSVSRAMGSRTFGSIALSSSRTRVGDRRSASSPIGSPRRSSPSRSSPAFTSTASGQCLLARPVASKAAAEAASATRRAAPCCSGTSWALLRDREHFRYVAGPIEIVSSPHCPAHEHGSVGSPTSELGEMSCAPSPATEKSTTSDHWPNLPVACQSPSRGTAARKPAGEPAIEIVAAAAATTERRVRRRTS